MNGRIPQDIVEQVRLSSDIAQVIGEYVKLKRRGRNMIGLCPFHQEKTPSFTVSPERQFYHCFGCNQGGNVFSFLMEHEKMSFPEAVRHLAGRCGVSIPETSYSTRDSDETDRLFYAHTVAQELYARTLRDTKYRSVYIDYLQRSRGLSEETIETFGLGLAGEGHSTLIKLAQEKGLSPELLARAGLAGYSEGRGEHYDRFRQRLMIPIQNLSDKIIAFGGRTLKKGEPAKYINSPETDLYSKSAVLYGLNRSKNAIRDRRSVIVVEGYFDLISLWQVGVRNVVASSGTAFTLQQARLLARFAETAFLFFDADSAGVKAAIRSVDSLFNAGVEVKVISAPPGEDPDSVSRQGAEAIERLIKDAERYLQFRLKNYDAKQVGLVERNKLIQELAEIGARISDPALRSLFVNEAAELMGVGSELFAGKKTDARVADSAGQTPPSGLSEDDWGARGFKTIEAELISLLLSHHQLIGQAAERISETNFESPRLRTLYAALLDDYKKSRRQDTAAFIGNLTDQALRKTATFLYTRRWETETPAETLEDYLNKIVTVTEIEPSIADLKNRLKEAEKAGDSKAADELTRELWKRLRESEAPVKE
ncbi:MAG: DNA primase [Candidatus Zixiibacteriota bacterium]